MLNNKSGPTRARFFTLASDDFCYVLAAGNGHTLGHVLAFLAASVVGVRRVHLLLLVGGRMRSAQPQHGQLEGELKGSLVLESVVSIVPVHLVEQTSRHHNNNYGAVS